MSISNLTTAIDISTSKLGSYSSRPTHRNAAVEVRFAPSYAL
jgi:hypothetical protein